MGGNAHICREINAGAEAQQCDSYYHEKDPYGHGPDHVPEGKSQEAGSVICYIAQEKEVDQGSDPDLLTVQEDYGDQFDHAQDNVCKSVTDRGGHLPEAALDQDGEGVYSEFCDVKESNAYAHQWDADQHHKDTSFGQIISSHDYLSRNKNISAIIAQSFL